MDCTKPVSQPQVESLNSLYPNTLVKNCNILIVNVKILIPNTTNNICFHISKSISLLNILLSYKISQIVFLRNVYYLCIFNTYQEIKEILASAQQTTYTNS